MSSPSDSGPVTTVGDMLGRQASQNARNGKLQVGLDTGRKKKKSNNKGRPAKKRGTGFEGESSYVIMGL